MLAHAYKIIIDRGVGSPGNGRKVVDGLNATNKQKSSNVNNNCATAWCFILLIKYGNAYLNCKNRNQISKGISKISFRRNTGT